METRAICTDCGFVSSDRVLKDSCPACGAPRSVFEPFEDRMSPARRKWLNQRAHQIMVAFPQVFVTVLFLSLICIALAPPRTAVLVHVKYTAKTLSLLVPFAVLGALITGYIDGRVRFTRLSGRFIRIKRNAGILLFACSCALASMIAVFGFKGPTAWITILVSLFALALSIVLGKLGGRLVCSEICEKQ